MEEMFLPPSAPAMMNSLRAIGYSFEAALADIVDNSVAADASTINIQFRTVPHLYVAIIDNGTGMSPERLIAAMRHGGFGPDQARGAGDLGRFGLGLKTASLSQCRCLTVVTLADGLLSGAQWDLTKVEARCDWVLGILSQAEISALPHVPELIASGHGTIVFWEELDRAMAGESAGDRALGELVDHGRDHLAFAFHRYLSGDEDVRKVDIFINNSLVRPVDPFLSRHRSTQHLPAENLVLEGVLVTFKPFILPHLSKLSKDDLALAGGEEGLRRQQGFFVYRNRRLITSGTWFRLLRQEELTKLARVQIDIPNTLDHLWALDVKKSAAHPPEAVRNGLRRIIERIANRSREVYRYRGRRSLTDSVIHAWERVIVRDGVNYLVNRSHPLVVAVREGVAEKDRSRLEQLLKMLELSFPADSLYADMASERNVQSPANTTEAEEILRGILGKLLQAAGSDTEAVQRLLDSLVNLEPFCAYPVLTQQITDSLRNAN